MSFAVQPYTPDNLSSLLSEAQDNLLGIPSYGVSGLSYDEAMNYAPAGMVQPRPLNGLGESASLNPVFYLLAAAALGYIFFVKKEHAF